MRGAQLGLGLTGWVAACEAPTSEAGLARGPSERAAHSRVWSLSVRKGFTWPEIRRPQMPLHLQRRTRRRSGQVSGRPPRPASVSGSPRDVPGDSPPRTVSGPLPPRPPSLSLRAPCVPRPRTVRAASCTINLPSAHRVCLFLPVLPRPTRGAVVSDGRPSPRRGLRRTGHASGPSAVQSHCRVAEGHPAPRLSFGT